jgi:hypothetical protein
MLGKDPLAKTIRYRADDLAKIGHEKLFKLGA